MSGFGNRFREHMEKKGADVSWLDDDLVERFNVSADRVGEQMKVASEDPNSALSRGTQGIVMFAAICQAGRIREFCEKHNIPDVDNTQSPRFREAIADAMLDGRMTEFYESMENNQ